MIARIDDEGNIEGWYMEAKCEHTVGERSYAAIENEMCPICMGEEIKQLRGLLTRAYRSLPEDRKGRTRCIDPDPAGSTYEFTEYDWSREIRALLGFRYEPTGI